MVIREGGWGGVGGGGEVEGLGKRNATFLTLWKNITKSSTVA